MYDAIIIPGGGLDPATAQPHPWVCARLDAALEYSNRTRFFIVLSRGSTHKPPPIDCDGFPITEAAASANYLQSHGITDSRILMDTWSLDTIGNAFFARTMICEPLVLRRFCIITSNFHMPRVRVIFDWVFKLDSWNTVLEYKETPDVGMTIEQSTARIQKECASLQNLRNTTIPKHDTLQKLAHFLMIEHKAYNVRSLANTGTVDNSDEPTCNNVASTY